MTVIPRLAFKHLNISKEFILEQLMKCFGLVK